jgi:hypothetical protein
MELGRENEDGEGDLGQEIVEDSHVVLVGDTIGMEEGAR